MTISKDSKQGGGLSLCSFCRNSFPQIFFCSVLHDKVLAAFFMASEGK